MAGHTVSNAVGKHAGGSGIADQENVMYNFNYHKAASAQSAATLVSGKADAKYLAGGQSLIATMKLRLAEPSDLIDLAGAAELKGIRVEGEKIVVGAMTTHADIAGNLEIKSKFPALAALAAMIGDRQIGRASCRERVYSSV